jgi:hypothetical protein
MKRRDFLASLNSMVLTGLSGAVPGLSLLASRSFALDAIQVPKKYFVMIRVGGGWDVTLGLDPKVHANGSEQNDMFIEYRPNDIIGSSALRLGPACGPLLPHINDIATINGIFLSDSNLGHDANLDYISTGNGLGHSADLSVELGHACGSGPFGILFNRQLKRANRNIMPTTIATIESLKNSINLEGLQEYMTSLKSVGEFRKSQFGLLESLPAKAKLVQALDSLKTEIDRSSSQGNLSQEAKQSLIVAAAFASRSSFQAQLDLSTQLDTHSAHEGTHLSNQKMVWEVIANMFRVFKNVPLLGSDGKPMGSLFDHTTFAVVSEFARTPALNSSGGKDHNPLTNSVLLAGAGVRGGQTFGQSQLITRKNSKNGEPRHVGGLIDFSNGNCAKSKEEARQGNFQFVHPENIAATIADISGVDRNRFASTGSDTSSIKQLIRS